MNPDNALAFMADQYINKKDVLKNTIQSILPQRKKQYKSYGK